MTTSESARAKALAFLDQAHAFQLGHLPTESRHPKTERLAELAIQSSQSALQLLHEVELESARSARQSLPQIIELSDTITRVLANGGRIFLAGCGSTGRLSVSLEVLWRREVTAQLARTPEGPEHVRLESWLDRVHSFIAGGDYALVRSIENFEDHPEYGARQLRDAGFGKADLLIGASEGGETPFVIGAVNEAASFMRSSDFIHSPRITQTAPAQNEAPYFLFCNPKSSLLGVERSRKVIEHPDIKSFSVLSGPMAVAGSTRLQASTVLMLAIGSALFAQFARQDSECGGHSPDQVGGIFDDFLNMLAATNFSALAPLVERESKVYARGGHCVHRAEEFAITVLTDTTERTPTFSLIPFENDFDPAAELSWTYLSVPHCLSAQEAWLKILGRAPRALAWPRFTAAYGISIVNGFNFSLDAETRREQASGPNGLFHFDIENSAHGLRLALDGEIALLPNAETFLRSDGLASSDVRYSPFHTSLLNSLIIKCALNFTSTLVMGRLGRFQSNLMLFVRSTNNKLIDRSIRYVKILLSEEGFVNFTYDEIATALFELMETVPADQSIVIAVCDHLRAKHAPQRSARFQKS